MTLTFRIPKADLPPLPAVGHHNVTVRARNAAGEGEGATPVPVRTLETLRKRMIRVNGRWTRVDDLAFATALQGLSARTLEDESGAITLAERITALQANISDVTATAIESLSTRVEMAEDRSSANAAAITSLVAEIAGAITAAAFMELIARVTLTENVDGSTTLAGLAQWLLKTTVGDLVAGVGLYNDGTISRFTVMADRFMILPSDAQDDEDARIPFAVVNGQVFINEAVIREASIGVAKIENGFLENLAAVHGTLEFARIRKGDIFDLTVSNIIQSDNYDPGVAGWIIRRDGMAELDAAAIRGTLSAEHIDSDVQNVVVLWDNPAGTRVSGTISVPLNADIGGFDHITGICRAPSSSWYMPWGIPTSALDISSYRSLVGPSGITNNDIIQFRIRRPSGQMLQFDDSNFDDNRVRIFQIIGVKNPVV